MAKQGIQKQGKTLGTIQIGSSETTNVKLNDLGTFQSFNKLGEGLD